MLQSACKTNQIWRLGCFFSVLSCRFYCPLVAEEWITQMFSPSVRAVLADLLTLSLCVYAGGMFHWFVAWIVAVNQPRPVCVYIALITLHLPPDSKLIHALFFFLLLLHLFLFSFSSSSPEASAWTQRGGHMSSSLYLCRPCGEQILHVHLGLLLCACGVWARFSTGRFIRCPHWRSVCLNS